MSNLFIMYLVGCLTAFGTVAATETETDTFWEKALVVALSWFSVGFCIGELHNR